MGSYLRVFANPLFLFKTGKGYLTDINKLKKYDEEKLNAYMEKSLRKIIRYANTTPFYHSLYRKAGVQIEDIKNFDDLKKLPTISKEDLRNNPPESFLPINFKKEKAVRISSSGTTGKPITLYADLFTIVRTMFALVRQIREYDINWRKNKMTIIPDLTAQSVESGYLMDGAISSFSPFFSFDNMQIFDTYSFQKREDLVGIINKINDFQPDFIGGYPGMLRHLAILIREGYNVDIHPKVMASTGHFLDPNTKKIIQEAFNSEIYQFYGSTEMGAIAYECPHNSFHIHSDLTYLETEEFTDYVLPENSGKLVITKLYGKGTPLIRYTGMNDIISLKKGVCKCGACGPQIDKIYGRTNQSIVLPDNRLILPFYLETALTNITFGFNTNMIDMFQIVQNSVNDINIVVKLNEDTNTWNVSKDKLFKELIKAYSNLFGKDVKLGIEKVDWIERKAPFVVNKLEIN